MTSFIELKNQLSFDQFNSTGNVFEVIKYKYIVRQNPIYRIMAKGSREINLSSALLWPKVTLDKNKFNFATRDDVN